MCVQNPYSNAIHCGILFLCLLSVCLVLFPTRTSVSVALSVCSSFFFVSLSLSPSPLSLRVVGGGAFQPYLPNKDSLRGWAGSQAPRLPRQSVETRMMSPRARVPQEALLTPVCDLGAFGGAVQAPVWDTALRQGVGLLTKRQGSRLSCLPTTCRFLCLEQGLPVHACDR